MSLKRGIIIAITGLAVETAALWSIDHFTHTNLVKRIGWTSIFVWGYFFTGFLTAHWLILWKHLIDKIIKPKQVKNQTSTANTSIPVSSQQRPMPARMAIQDNAMPAVAPQQTQGTTSTTTALSATPVSEPISQRAQDIRDLCNLKGDLSFETFEHVHLEGHRVDLVFSSDSCALMCVVFSDEHTWTIDTSSSIEDAVWTDENGQTKRPCLLLLQQAAALEKMEPDSTLIPTIILMRGSIKNYEEAIPYLQNNHITVATYQPDVMPHVESIHDLLITYFSPFPPSYNDLVPPEEQEETSQPQEDNNA